MKWKLYRYCCLYNIAVCLIITFFLLSEVLDVFVFFILLVIAVPLIKNIMGYRLYVMLKNQTEHSHWFAAGFYFLWFFNLLLTLFTLYSIFYDDTDYSNFYNRELLFYVLVVGRISLAFSSAYTLPLDLILERKVSKLVLTAADSLLKDERQSEAE